jgi:hypothetical protein
MGFSFLSEDDPFEAQLQQFWLFTSAASNDQLEEKGYFCNNIWSNVV